MIVQNVKNRYLSCSSITKHFAVDLGDKIKDRSVVALLNHNTLWHMHKPLPDSCILELLHYQIPNPTAVNKVFWRTCSYLLGAVMKEAFKDNIKIHLHSFPSPNGKSHYKLELCLTFFYFKLNLVVLCMIYNWA